MLLLIDIGNTHTHLGLGSARRVVKQLNLPTASWNHHRSPLPAKDFVGSNTLDGVVLCSVVPRITAPVCRWVRQQWGLNALRLNCHTLVGLGINYPHPESIGADRLANSLAAFRQFGAPVIALDFGTAVTFDVIDRHGDYIGGIITPGLAAMTDYLHDRTALLPRIRIRETNAVIGRNTEQAMLVGAVHGYRGLIRELIAELKRELRARSLPVVATGGYACLMARQLKVITAVEPNLTLEGLRLLWYLRH